MPTLAGDFWNSDSNGYFDGEGAGWGTVPSAARTVPATGTIGMDNVISALGNTAGALITFDDVQGYRFPVVGAGTSLSMSSLRGMSYYRKYPTGATGLQAVAGCNCECACDSLCLCACICACNGICCACWSDRRLKDDVRPITRALEKTLDLQGVYYEMIQTGRQEIGLIAQDTELVVPEVIITDEDGIKMIEYGKLAGLFVEAIRELDTKYGAKMAQMEAKIKYLEKGGRA